MGELFERIQRAVRADRVIISDHADEMFRERRIPIWQVVAGIEEGHLLIERPDDEPNPVVEVEQLLSDGTPIKAVWAWLRYTETAKLVTVHYFDA